MIRTLVPTALGVVPSLFLAGCATAPLMPPLKPASLGRSIEARQQITVHYRGHTRSLQVALRVAPGDLTLIGLSAIGQRLFTLAWNGRQMQLTGAPPGLKKKLRPRRVLADLELAYWPVKTLRAALPDRQLRLQQLGTTRTLWRGDRLLWIAYRGRGDRWHSPLTIYNARLNYRLDVRPLAFNGHGTPPSTGG